MPKPIFCGKYIVITFLHIFLIILNSSNDSLAHGMGKRGPHGGFIQMPGAFHTELVPQEDNNAFNVYLIDGNFKNPTVRDSSIEVTLKVQGQDKRLDCVSGSDRFICKMPDGKSVKDRAKIYIKAVREKNSRGIAIYNLPLKLQ